MRSPPWQWRRRLKAYNFPKRISPFPKDISHRACQNVKKTAFTELLVVASDRDTISKPKLVNITVESESKNLITFGKPSAFEIKKWLIVVWKVDFESAIDVSMYDTYIGMFTYLLAFISRSKVMVPNVPKSNVFVKLPFLESTLFQIRKKYYLVTNLCLLI